MEFAKTGYFASPLGAQAPIGAARPPEVPVTSTRGPIGAALRKAQPKLSEEAKAWKLHPTPTTTLFKGNLVGKIGEVGVSRVYSFP